MRLLKSHFRDDALTPLETVGKWTKEARVFRCAHMGTALYHARAPGLCLMSQCPSPPPLPWGEGAKMLNDLP